MTQGPGTYNPYAEKRGRREASSVFKSTSKRGFAPPRAGPAPGDYNRCGGIYNTTVVQDNRSTR